MKLAIGIFSLLISIACQAIPHKIRTRDASHLGTAASTILDYDHFPALPSDPNDYFKVSADNADIQCFELGPTRPKTDVAGCRPTLRKFTTFPDRRKQQEFSMYESPKAPHTPPFGFRQFDSTCVVELFEDTGRVKDKFSWEDLRLLAQDIVGYCEEDGQSAGGTAKIGPKHAWEVAVLGTRPGPFSSNSTTGPWISLNNQTSPAIYQLSDIS